MEKKKAKKSVGGGKVPPGKSDSVTSILDEVKMLVSYKARLDDDHMKPRRRSSLGNVSKTQLGGTKNLSVTNINQIGRGGSMNNVADLKKSPTESLKMKLKGKKDYLCFDQTGVMTKKLVEQTVARELQNATGGTAAAFQVSSSTDDENQSDSDGDNNSSDGIANWRPKAGTKTKTNVKNTVEQLAANLLYNLRHYSKGWFNTTASHYPEYFIEISSYERFSRKPLPKEAKTEANENSKKPV